MKRFQWSPTKNAQLIAERNISFEKVLFCIANGKILDDKIHPNQQKYPNQRVLVIELNEYAYLVPYIETDDLIFLKTIIPSRKATKDYLKGIES